MSVPRGESECLAALAALGITPTIVSHAAVTTVDAWKAEFATKSVDASLAKNMFLKGKKGELVLVFAMASTATDLKAVCKAVGAASGSLRFAAEDALHATLGVVQGSVTPLALINDTQKVVKLVLDSAVLTTAGLIAVHPCRNDQSALLTAAQLSAFFDQQGFKPVVVDFVAAAAEAAEAAAAAPAASAAPAKKEAKKDAPAAAVAAAGADDSTETKLGMDVKKLDDFAEWYSQVITKSEMIEYYDVSGCYIMRPWAFGVWDVLKRFLTDGFRELGVEECYFPMFVSKSALEREKDHVEGFAPEVAWVTKAGETDLENPIAIRPTSETVMYPTYAKWIRSHRDLPVQLNQWCSVVRWEFSHPTPFIRTREFLWQEGHSAWQTEAESDREVRQILELYRRAYEELLAVPVEPGQKTEKEKFAGGHYTTTVEAYVGAVGRAVQGATSHNLGQNFGKMFDITFEDPAVKGAKLIPWQTSWGFTWRSIGVAIMVHGDDKGLVLPPRVASLQVVIVPCGITAKTTEAERAALLAAAATLQDELKKGGLRAKADLRGNYSPGWRYNYWELKGVPVRIELGPRELGEKKLVCCTRHNATKQAITWDGNVVGSIRGLLDEIHDAMFAKAKAERESRTKTVTEWKDFTPLLNEKNLLLAPFCLDKECEGRIKKTSAEESKAMQANAKDDEKAPSMGAKSLCIPFRQPCSVDGMKCVFKSCQSPAGKWVLFGRSY